jgi:hypothetical protein
VPSKNNKKTAVNPPEKVSKPEADKAASEPAAPDQPKVMTFSGPGCKVTLSLNLQYNISTGPEKGPVTDTVEFSAVIPDPELLENEEDIWFFVEKAVNGLAMDLFKRHVKLTMRRQLLLIEQGRQKLLGKAPLTSDDISPRLPETHPELVDDSDDDYFSDETLDQMSKSVFKPGNESEDDDEDGDLETV